MSNRRLGRRPKGNLEHFKVLRDLCTEDEGWYNIFDELAQGIMPVRGVKFTDNKLSFKIRGKGKPVEVQLGAHLDPMETLQECISCFRSMGIKTSDEAEAIKKKQEERNNKGFGSIKSQRDRLHYIDRYIERVTLIEGLNEKESLELQHRVVIGFLTGRITNQDVTFANNRIETIEIK